VVGRQERPPVGEGGGEGVVVLALPAGGDDPLPGLVGDVAQRTGPTGQRAVEVVTQRAEGGGQLGDLGEQRGHVTSYAGLGPARRSESRRSRSASRQNPGSGRAAWPPRAYPRSRSRS